MEMFIKFNAQMYSCHSYKHVFRVAAQLNLTNTRSCLHLLVVV